MSAKAEKPAITAKNYLIVGPGEHPCGNNLYLVVTDGGGRNWSFRYQRDGIKKKMGFGSVRDVKLSEAKDMAIDKLRLLAQRHRSESRPRRRPPRFGLAPVRRVRQGVGRDHQDRPEK
jgi:Arm DNA-binding domain